MKRPGQKGFSISEMLVAGVVVGLLFLVMHGVYSTTGRRLWLDSRGKIDVQQRALVVTNRMIRELQQSNIHSVVIFPQTGFSTWPVWVRTAEGIGFLSAEAYNDQSMFGPIQQDRFGELLWVKFVIYYHDKAQNQLRRVEFVRDVNDGELTKDKDLRSITLLPAVHSPTLPPQGAKNQVLAEGVEAISFGSPATPPVNPIPITLRMYVGKADDKARYVTDLKSRVMLRNSLRLRDEEMQEGEEEAGGGAGR